MARTKQLPANQKRSGGGRQPRRLLKGVAKGREAYSKEMRRSGDQKKASDKFNEAYNLYMKRYRSLMKARDVKRNNNN